MMHHHSRLNEMAQFRGLTGLGKQHLDALVVLRRPALCIRKE
jgi:hypothetical protein